MLTRKQVLYGLERVELRTSSIFDECPLDLNNKKSRQNLCSGFSLLFRTPSGQCNNIKQPSWGSSFIPFLRFLPPDYRYKIFKIFFFKKNNIFSIYDNNSIINQLRHTYFTTAIGDVIYLKNFYFTH